MQNGTGEIHDNHGSTIPDLSGSGRLRLTDTFADFAEVTGALVAVPVSKFGARHG